jgi:hypothetical protein
MRTIYVQYQNLDGDQSQVYTQTIWVDPLPPESYDFVINAGAPVTWIPELTLSLIAPPDAVFVSISEGHVPDLYSTHWVDASPLMPLVIGGTGLKQVFVRWKTIDGDVSEAVRRTIYYDPFPFGASGVSIDGGAASTTDADVALTLFAPPHLTQMRVGLDPLTIRDLPFMEYDAAMTFTIPDAPGTHKVYVQFANALGEPSPVYFDEILKN